jgi:hypothetical protein
MRDRSLSRSLLLHLWNPDSPGSAALSAAGDDKHGECLGLHNNLTDFGRTTTLPSIVRLI